MRIVIDTNVIVSALFYGGHPDELLKQMLVDEIKVVASAEIVAEYKRTIQKFIQKANRDFKNITLTDVLRHIEIITPTSKIEVCRDKDDDKFIACAVDGKCIYIVSGDKDLLDVQTFNDIEIVTVREFMDKYYK